MSLFRWKSRKKLKFERDYYKEMLEKEQKRCDDIRGEKINAEWKASENEKENKALVEENKKLKDENLAKLNIINEERRKTSKRIDQMQKRIDKLEGELKAKKGGDSKEDNDLPFDSITNNTIQKNGRPATI